MLEGNAKFAPRYHVHVSLFLVGFAAAHDGRIFLVDRKCWDITREGR